jgi:hypothetical protein
METYNKNKKKRTEILNGDEVIFIGKSLSSWSSLEDYGLLKEGEAYIVHLSLPNQLSLVGLPGIYDKTLFKLI